MEREKEIYKVLLHSHRRSYHLHFIDLMIHSPRCLFTTKLGTQKHCIGENLVCSHQSIVVWNDRSKLISVHSIHLRCVCLCVCVYVSIMVKIPIHPFLKHGFFATSRWPRMLEENVVRIKRLLGVPFPPTPSSYPLPMITVLLFLLLLLYAT